MRILLQHSTTLKNNPTKPLNIHESSTHKPQPSTNRQPQYQAKMTISTPKGRLQEPGTVESLPSHNHPLLNPMGQTITNPLHPLPPIPLPPRMRHGNVTTHRPRTPRGQKHRTFKGGRFEGPRIKGEILHGGGDWKIVHNNPPTPLSAFPHNTDPQQVAHFDTRSNLLTYDGTSIYPLTTGICTGSSSILEELGDGEITPDQSRMQLHLTVETGDERYSWVHDGVFVASSARSGNIVVHDADQLLRWGGKPGGSRRYRERSFKS